MLRDCTSFKKAVSSVLVIAQGVVPKELKEEEWAKLLAEARKKGENV